MNIEQLDTSQGALIEFRDEFLAESSDLIYDSLAKNDLKQAIENFKELFVQVNGISGSFYIINEFTKGYLSKLDSILEELLMRVLEDQENPERVKRELTLLMYKINSQFFRLLWRGDEEEIRQEFIRNIENALTRIEDSDIEETAKKELVIIVDFFKIGLPTSAGLFNDNYYEFRRGYVNGFSEFVTSNPKLEDSFSFSNLCSNIGGILLEDQPDLAKMVLDFSLSTAMESKSPTLTSRALFMLGHYYRLKGQLDIALDTYQQSMEIEGVPHLLLAYPIRHIGEILQTRGELLTAKIYYEKSLDLFQFVLNKLAVARTLQYMGNISFLEASFDEALSWYDKSLQVLLEYNYQRMIADLYYSHIRVYLEQERIEEAEKVLEDLESLHHKSNHRGIDQVYFICKALVLKRSKRRVKKAKAHELLEEFIGNEVLNHQYTIVAMQNLCELLVDEMRTEPAEEIFEEASELVNRLLLLGQEQNLYQVQIQALILQSQFDMVQGKFDQTLEKLSEAEEMCREKNLPQLTEYVARFRERYLTEFSKWRNIVHDNETVQDRLANPDVQEYIKLALATVQEEKQQTETLLQTVLPIEIIPYLKSTTEVYAEKFENVCILFADIVGFTEISARLDPHEMVLLLNEIFTMFDTLLPKYDVEKIRTIGDNYMVVVGAPRRNENSTHLMAGFALEISDYLKQNRDALRGITFRIGMNTGEVVAGVVGTDRYHFDVWGDAVNVAARMESHGVPGKIQVTEEVYNGLKDDFQFEERGIIEIKGKKPLRTWFLSGKL
ncbi:MAG: adenylate/guanylate cyclase domain-containing protein [Candidatus Kariarchaeaceae archaeon]